MKVEPYAVAVIPITEQSNDLITKEYRVPPDFVSTSLTGTSLLQRGAYTKAAGTAAVAGPAGTGKDTQESTGGQQLVNREGAREFLESQGVPFPPGASANFLPQSSRLIVRNTQDNLDLIDAIVEQLNLAIPKQVEIESKFVEIQQTEEHAEAAHLAAMGQQILISTAAGSLTQQIEVAKRSCECEVQPITDGALVPVKR